MKKKLNPKLSPVEYKKNAINIWNEIAPRYNKRWAKKNSGPFESSQKVVKILRVKRNDFVLDAACGTGALTKKISNRVGPKGFVLGIDFSFKALKIAKNENSKIKNLDFALLDCEKMNFQKIFDIITCQYALFFFPNARNVLKNFRKILKKRGVLVVVVHGERKHVPFFSCILDAVLKFIPDYLPVGGPSLDRFGNANNLKKEIQICGFKKIKVFEYNFPYSPGNFSDYWSNFLNYIAKPQKTKLNSISKLKKNAIKEQAKKNTLPFLKKNGQIVFPWKVLILTAVNQ